jgi:hypothetical protein
MSALSRRSLARLYRFLCLAEVMRSAGCGGGEGPMGLLAQPTGKLCFIAIEGNWQIAGPISVMSGQSLIQ